ncbi:hypothetical protein KUTeg_024332 [Tegillarca granosa]|uniref:EF-hand domain-containing protein n=1 Tax=Tegillarca granosa TaxID=220873 RepID=A0ABQ9DX13_TEGGR|nr:hypothetical protein KUTeg_024332 [Tegillarca granosa]
MTSLWVETLKRKYITPGEEILLDRLLYTPPGIIMPQAARETTTSSRKKKLIRPSSAAANLQSHPKYSTSLFDNGRPSTASQKSRIQEIAPLPKRPVTQAAGSRQQWKSPQVDNRLQELNNVKQPRRLTLGSVEGLAELKMMKMPSFLSTGTGPQTLKSKIEEQINIDTLEELKSAFAEADENKTGELSLNDFKSLLKQRLHLRGNKENQIDSLFMKIDWSSAGAITWDEFCTYMQLEYAEKEDSYLRAKEVAFHLPAKSVIAPNNKNPVLRITDSADNFVACSHEGAVTFWNASMDLKRKRSVITPPAKSKWITDYVIMTEFHKFIIGTGDREIQFFELSSFEPYCQISGMETVPLKLDYCGTGPDQCLILYGDSQGCINILVISSAGQCLRTWKKVPSPDQHIATVTLDSIIKNGEIEFIRWQVHNDWVQQLKYYHEIGQIISCSNHTDTALVIGCTRGSTRVDQQLKEIKESMEEKSKNRSYTGTTAIRTRLDADQSVFRVYKGVKCFSFSKDKNIIVTGGMDRIVRLWNPYVSLKPTAMLRGHNAPIFYLFIADEENRIFSISTDRCVKVWDIQDHNCLLTIRPKGHKIEGNLQACHYSSALKSLAIATDQMWASLNLKLKSDNNIKMISARPSLHADVVTHKEPVTCCKYNPSFKQVVTCSEGSVIKLWDFETGTFIFDYGEAHGDTAITCMTFDNTGRRLITGGRDGILKVWNYNNGHCLRILQKEEDNDEITDLCYVEMNRNRYIVAVGWDRRIHIYSDSVSDSNIHLVQHPNPKWSDDLKHGHQEDILAVAQCPPNLLATAGYDGEIIVWNMVSGHIFCHLRAPAPPDYEDQSLDGDLSINAMVFMRKRAADKEREKESATLIASGPRAHIHFWNVFQGGSLKAQFSACKTKGAMISALALDKDNITLYSGDSFGFVYVWDIEGYCVDGPADKPPDVLKSWRGHIDSITCMDLVEEHKVLLTASNDCTVRMWNVEGDYIGTFGQPDTWNLYNPSTYQHPMVPSDVLFDPMSLPTHPLIKENTNIRSILMDDDFGSSDKADKPKRTPTPPQFGFQNKQQQEFYVNDEQIASQLKDLGDAIKDETLTEEEEKKYKGKWLRHEKTKIKPIEGGGPSDYRQLKWSSIKERPRPPTPKCLYKKKDDPFDFDWD